MHKNKNGRRQGGGRVKEGHSMTQRSLASIINIFKPSHFIFIMQLCVQREKTNTQLKYDVSKLHIYTRTHIYV